MRIGNVEIHVVGDRILVAPEEGEEHTSGGILVPATAVRERQVLKGRVVAVGPGLPVPPPADVLDEPWKERPAQPAYVPLQAQVGDQALFLRNAAIEIRIRDRTYWIVPNAAVLILERPVAEERF